MTSSGWDVVVVGGANVDYLVKGAVLPRPGETALGDAFHEGPGGKGANQAVAAARLGARVAFVAKLGQDARAELVLANLVAEGVDPRHVVRDAERPTGVALISVNAAGQKQIHVAAGANGALAADDVRRAASAIVTAKIVLAQLEVPIDAVAAAARQARQAGARFVLDPAPPVALPPELWASVDVLRANSAEAEALTGVSARDRDGARVAAARLRERGVGAVAVQAGEEGNLLVWPDGELLLPKLPVRSVDATGAGDAFAGALAVALAEGRPFPEAGRFANAAAALATTQVGAQAGLPRREAILRLLGD